MDFNILKDKSVRLLGKTRALNLAEFEILLEQHGVVLVKSGGDFLIEGRMLDPYEQIELDECYKIDKSAIIELDSLERWLCQFIEPNRLLMSLKLSKNRERLIAFLLNSYISDELFFRLLKLYDYGDDGLFESDDNRDVSAAIISRFYKDLDKNHNIQYAMSGFTYLVERYATSELIESLIELKPIKKELNSLIKTPITELLDAIALHKNTPLSVLERLISSRAELIAMREPLELEDKLECDEVLSKNKTLSKSRALKLIDRYPENIAQFIELDSELFDRLKEHSIYLSQNSSLEQNMIDELIKDSKNHKYLARNSAFMDFERLIENRDLWVELASNESLSESHFSRLYNSNDSGVLTELAKNINTPIEMLYQLHLDQRFERFVKSNISFANHIKFENMGWF